MSLKRILRIFESYGLSRPDAKVYVYLAKKGPKTEQDLARALKMAKKQLRLSLANLKTKGIVTVNVEHSVCFSALTFENVLDRLIRANIDRARIINEKRDDLIAGWPSCFGQQEK